jgi:PBP1b-binding outer membrane lipoprotein LpoB
MKRLIGLIPWFLLLAGCSQKTENNSSHGTPIDTYRQGIDRAQEVRQKSDERAKNLDSISQGDQ